LIFSPSTKDNFPLRLLSFSEDRNMVEFDLPNSVSELKIKSRRQLEQTAKITGGSWYFSDWNSSEKYIVTTNSHYKIRLYRQDTLMCRYTFLCPTYGGPLKGYDGIYFVKRYHFLNTFIRNVQFEVFTPSRRSKNGLSIF
jgi:hypothetical protein